MKTVSPRHILALSIIVISSAVTLYAQEKNDTVAKDLQEVTVEGEMQRIDATTATYYPTAKVKKASNNAIDLLYRMAISQLRVDPRGMSVKTTTGEKVTVFLNYLQATDADIYGLRSADVLKVEYLEFPTDPRFKGARHVVNIILRRYIYGGYTKLSEDVTTLTDMSSRGSLYSKFAYRKMLYDVYAGPQYRTYDHDGTLEKSVFHLADRSIERNQDHLGGEKNIFEIPVSFRAIYEKPGIQIANTFGFGFFDIMKSTDRGSLDYTPDINATEYSYERNTPCTSRSYSWNGGYYFIFPKNLSLYVIPSFAYTNSDAHNTYTATIPGVDPVVNDHREDAYYASLGANLYKTFNNRHSIVASLSGNISNNSIDYMGTSPSHNDYSSSILQGIITYNFNHNNMFTGSLMLSGVAFRTKMNGKKESTYYPTLYLSAAWSPTRKSRFSFSANLYSTPAAGANLSPNIIQINEILYQTGNPELKSYRTFNSNLSYTYFASNSLNLQAYAGYNGYYNRSVQTFAPYKDGRCVIESEMNSGDFNRFSAGVNLTARLFSNSLILQASPGVSHQSSSGYYDESLTRFEWSLDAQYYFGSFNLSAYYNPRGHIIEVYNGSHNRNAEAYGIKVGWANNSWNISVRAHNFFRTGYIGQWTDLVTPVYERHSDIISGGMHASLDISVTYTIGYGKKVGRGNEIGAQGGAGSAAFK